MKTVFPPTVAFIIVVLLCFHPLILSKNAQYAINSEKSSFLKYVVNDVFIGELKHVIKITNLTQRRVDGVNLYVPLVNNETARHYAILYNVESTKNYSHLLDGSGNMYVYWKNLIIPQGQTFTVELNYRVLSFSTTYTVNSSMIRSYDESSELYIKYTQPEELIESDNREIVEKARDITQGVENLYEKARLIYSFVINYLQYEVQDEERGALWALENRVGDCSEYSYLFVALCRAAGIPARVQAGFAFHYAGQVLEDGHMWAEYYLENYGWIPVDATWQLFNAMDNKHFSSIWSIPETIPYSNYYINGTDTSGLVNGQMIQLTALKPSAFDDYIFAQNITAAVQRIKQAETAISIGKIFGASIVFSSETREVEQKLLNAKIHVQNAVDTWGTSAQIASSNALLALENAEQALYDVWMLIFKAFALYMGILIALVLILIVFFRRPRKGLSGRVYTSHIATVTFNINVTWV
ncbi:MAG: transglutaminase-like domain-containing protein [Candidatus Bathyarchaeia archaeon]